MDFKAFDAARIRLQIDYTRLAQYGVITEEEANRFLHSGGGVLLSCEIAPPKTEKKRSKSASENIERKPVSKPQPKPAQKESAIPPKTELPQETRQAPDEVLRSLTPAQLAIMQAMPDDHPITADSLGGLGYPYSDIIAALTMLEILGLIRKLPGALYSKV